ncbi:putative N6-adenine methyltransferase-domain-containing protein [Triangularia verruculosa]|uniref:Protein-lysine N-methyltransferase EFM5 n=1 Tax=Triangularia verruculosa TaxID=2587418 RepID=A0AAN6X6W8_9PEZI|nr:putative N6-adenine methyltransferase-domain-containing protein [Triangularia verruculosa]
MASMPTAVRTAAPTIARSALYHQRRALSDVHITRTGKPLIRTQGGRSSLGEHTATVFGATGRLGRYIVNRLARQGCTVIVPYREEMAKRHLKVTGDLGRVVFMEYDLRNTPSIEESVRHSDVVYNLVGRNYPTKNFSYEDVHIEGAERIAEAVAKYDVDRFIHVSSYNADPNHVSEYYSTKGRAEHVVRSIFPETTIVRPAPMFGFEDNLLLKLASVVNLFTSNNMQEKFWPVHVIDVGEALEKMLWDDNTASQTFELYGPKQYQMAEIAKLVDREIFKKRRHINVPKAILKPAAAIVNKALWWDIMSADEVEREFHDQVIDETAKTFKDLDIEPTDISKWTYHYLQGFRSSTFYDLPPATEKEKREDRKYLHVLDDALSSSALDALKEFYAEREARQEQFVKLQAKAEEQRQQKLSMDAFGEDWNESQFWYSEETANFFAKQLLLNATSDMTIGVVSAPSVFVALRNILNAASESEPKPTLLLLEHDNRFAVFPEFHFYDFAEPTKLPSHLKASCDRIICDPPFLSQDCQTKAAITVNWLFKPAADKKIIVCTGERMEALVTRLYRSVGIRTTDYEPVHARGLSNEFYCYANFDSLGWKWMEEDK